MKWCKDRMLGINMPYSFINTFIIYIYKPYNSSRKSPKSCIKFKTKVGDSPVPRVPYTIAT